MIALLYVRMGRQLRYVQAVHIPFMLDHLVVDGINFTVVRGTEINEDIMYIYDAPVTAPKNDPPKPFLI